MPEQTSRANKAEAVLLFVAPAAQKKNPARLAFCSGLLLDIGKVNAIALHEKPYGYSDDQERRQIDRNVSSAHMWFSVTRTNRDNIYHK